MPPENPDRLQGPEVGTLCLYRYKDEPPMVVRVLERSYVWAPGERSGSRRYDLKVIAKGPNGTRHALVDDAALTPYDGPLTEGMTL